MIADIADNFSIEKIIENGQCFRPKMLPDGRGFFITGNKCLTIREVSRGKYEASCAEQEWRDTR